MLENEITDTVFSVGHFETPKGKLKCKICSKNYAVKDSLKVHMLTIHEKKMSLICTFENCTKRYFNKYKLECHLRTHTGERPYQCTQCIKTFTTKGNLTTHTKLHNNPLKFKCNFCAKQYTSKGNLLNHINIVHFKLKKHFCTICKQCFGRSSSLKTHMIIHTGEKPFVCLVNDCGKKYAEKGNLFMHQKRKHRDYFIDGQKPKSNYKETIEKTEENVLGSTVIHTDSEQNNDNGIDEIINQFEIQCLSAEDKIQEDILMNILGSEEENSIGFYLNHQEEENYIESGTFK